MRRYCLARAPTSSNGLPPIECTSARRNEYRVGRVVLAGDAAHVTNPTGGLGLTSGLFDSYALYPALTAVILEGADDQVLDRYAAARRDTFINRVSPQATRKQTTDLSRERRRTKARGGAGRLAPARDGSGIPVAAPDVHEDVGDTAAALGPVITTAQPRCQRPRAATAVSSKSPQDRSCHSRQRCRSRNQCSR